MAVGIAKPCAINQCSLDLIEQSGVSVVLSTSMHGFGPGVRTPVGAVTAGHVLRARLSRGAKTRKPLAEICSHYCNSEFLDNVTGLQYYLEVVVLMLQDAKHNYQGHPRPLVGACLASESKN